jgi:integrase
VLLAAGEAPSWVAAMLGHPTPEMLFQVYARYIPNRTRRDGSALSGRMAPNSGAHTPYLLPSAPPEIQTLEDRELAKGKCERGT